MHTVRTILLLVISLNLLMIGIRLGLDPQLLKMPGGFLSALEPAALSTGYGFMIIWLTRRDSPLVRAVVRQGTAVGIVSGTLEVLHITLENYGYFDARVESVLTGGFLSGLLLLWCIAGYRVARVTADLGAGSLAGCWSAMVGMLMATTYGFSQLFWDLPRLEQRNIASPDFVRSGWTDLHTFSIADIFEAGFKILLVGPVVGGLVGGLGAAIAATIRGIKGRTPV